MSRLAARSSGVMFWIASDSPLMCWSRTCSRSCSTSAWNSLARLRAPGSRSPPGPDPLAEALRQRRRADRAAGRPGRPASSGAAVVEGAGGGAPLALAGESAVVAEPRLRARCPGASGSRLADVPGRAAADPVALLGHDQFSSARTSPACRRAGTARGSGAAREALQQVAEAGHVRPRRIGRSASRVPSGGAARRQVAVGHQVVGSAARISSASSSATAACRPSASSGRWRIRTGSRLAGQDEIARDRAGRACTRSPPVDGRRRRLARSLLSRRCRCRPSSRNSTAEATTAGDSAPPGRRRGSRRTAAPGPASRASSGRTRATACASPVSSTRPSSNAWTTSSSRRSASAPIERCEQRLGDQPLDDPLLGRLVAGRLELDLAGRRGDDRAEVADTRGAAVGSPSRTARLSAAASQRSRGWRRDTRTLTPGALADLRRAAGQLGQLGHQLEHEARHDHGRDGVLGGERELLLLHDRRSRGRSCAGSASGPASRGGP